MLEDAAAQKKLEPAVEHQDHAEWRRAVVLWHLGPWPPGTHLTATRSAVRFHHFLNRPIRYVLLRDETGLCLEYMEEHARKHLAVVYDQD